MKIALGIFIGFFVCCVLFIVLAPDSVHEAIDRIHGNSDANGKLSVDPEDNSEGGVIPSDEKTETVSESSVVPEGNSEEEWGPFDEKSEPVVMRKRKVTKSSPLTEDEILDWLERHDYDYTVGEGQGFYRIYWRNLKEVSAKPTAIVVNNDGTVVPKYGGHSVTSGGSIVSTGNNNTYTVINNNGIATTASIKYENGSWWIETIRSFDWVPSQDNINDVLSKAKK